ncbi:MAG: hypothetical protein FJX47_03925 [Alphaproteobacteria bacterium]|nr:hypothetical protein [Alphaproteobacteria bacterium]
MLTISQKDRQAIATLCRKHGALRLDLFGSGATDRFDPKRSDLDFMVAFAAMPPATYAEAYFGLKEGLESLFQRPVDLISEDTVENPYLRASIEASRMTLHAA